LITTFLSQLIEHCQKLSKITILTGASNILIIAVEPHPIELQELNCIHTFLLQLSSLSTGGPEISEWSDFLATR